MAKTSIVRVIFCHYNLKLFKQNYLQSPFCLEKLRFDTGTERKYICMRKYLAEIISAIIKNIIIDITSNFGPYTNFPLEILIGQNLQFIHTNLRKQYVLLYF